MSDENISVDLGESKPKKKVKSKKIAKAAKAKKAKAPKKPKGKARAKIDLVTGTRKEIKVAEAVYDELQKFADKQDLPSAGHAADKLLVTGLVRRAALDKYAKRVAKGEVGK